MLRQRKNRRYNETTDEDGERKFNLQDKIKSKRFDLTNRDKHLLEYLGQEVNLKLIQEKGFDKPILVVRPDGLDLRVPPKSFLVRNVRDCVGHERLIDVMDVKTQKNIEMSMKDWCKYYESRNRDRLLNVISLEFSHTKLDELVDSPMIVKLLDWVDLVWPKFLKESQTESTNSIDKMKYPKVQKYCLMSVKGSYTDFHIDFGGTSVWYHILRGRKIFWMVPPTDLNLSTFEEWTLSGMQQTVFFGDTVEECFRVELEAGNTFFIPSGWIHAVYTQEDSLVFGGNFLHSFGIENQLRVSKIEDSTKVPIKFRYPFYTEILWYVVQHYVYCLTGKDHLHRPEAATPAIESNESNNNNSLNAKNKQQNNIEKRGSNCNAEDEDDDESTESEQKDKCDNKRRKAVPRKRGKRATTPAKNSTKRPKKPPTDDESTEIDSAAEESVSADKPTTCRMTKNSLLRLQYELEEKEQQQQQVKQSPGKSTAKQTSAQQIDKNTSNSRSSSKKQTATSTKAQTLSDSSPNTALSTSNVQSTAATLNLADIVLSSQESSTLNGWSTGTGAAQSGWSAVEPESKGPLRVHLTRYELNGLKALVKHLSKLSGAKKHVPSLIKNTRVLLDDCKKMIAEHEQDIPELAVTGKPVTPELLNTKRADINEMIKQFFKPSNEPESTDETSMQSSVAATSGNSRSKLYLDTSRIEEKKSTMVGDISSSSNNTTSDHDHAPKSPTKEAKCFSPSKKLSNSISSTSNSSPPPRPKSPPTRPLSNNQYTSKTKNNNNLLLPGSFADLIAATSTEKKAFDVSGADVTNSLFGAKDPATKQASKATCSKIKKETPSSSSMAAGKLSEGSAKPSVSPDISTSTSISSEAKDRQQLPQHKPSSPEPPKTQPIQKRFINPAFRPQNKEKLIFASAPYVSPVHAPEQSRLPNQSYPWQTPAPHQASVSNQSNLVAAKNPHSFGSASPTIPQSPLSPFILDQQKPTSSDHNHQTSVSLSSPQTDQSKLDTPQPSVASEPRRNSSGNLEKDGLARAHTTPVARGEVIVMKPQQFHTAPYQARPKIQQSHQNTDATRQESPTPRQDSKVSPVGELIKPNSKPSPSNTAPKPPEIKEEPIASGSSAPASQPIAENEQKAKKTTKPRGPPKKSKEARQAIEFADVKPPVVISQPVSMPISVVRLAPPTSVISTPPTTVQPPTQTKPKAKRTKKQKNNPTQAISNSVPTFVTATAPSLSRPQIQPSVICGLVTQPQSGSSQISMNSKMAPQQYLISRPLMFNTMPAMSTAQFQQMSRASMPIITSPGMASLGMPLQQGARIIWATQPRAMTTPVTTKPSSTQPRPTTSAGSSQVNKQTPSNRPPVTSANSDNAALLSLATTALSTAPMTHSSPSLVSHLGPRAPTSQAIMVSSASNQAPTFLAGQQLFRPLVQSMPMTHFVSRPGAPRPTSGQLVFARLPNQNQQARFLITNPNLMTQRLQAPQLVAGQSNPTLAFATFKPSTDTTKAIKSKKVKTS